MSKPQIVHLATYSGIWAHSLSEANVVRSLKGAGFEVIQFFCDGVIPGMCHVRESRGRSESQIAKNSNIDCKDCKFSSRVISAFQDSVAKHWMSEYLTSDDLISISRMRQHLLANGTGIDAEFEGLKLVRFAAYEVMLSTKSMDLNLDLSVNRKLLDSIVSCYMMMKVSRAFFSENIGVSAALVRTPQFALHRVFSAVAKENGVRVMYLDASPNFSESYTHLSLKDLEHYFWKNPANDFHALLSHEPSANDQKRINQHFKTLFAGKSHRVYSSAKRRYLSDSKIKDAFGVLEGQKVLLAALSSTDEPLAAKISGLEGLSSYPGKVFESQLIWVKWLIAWVSNFEEFRLILRLHPREFPNKRETQKAPMADVWEQELGQLPANVSLNHPDDGISLYNLLEITDVMTTGWSSAAIEASYFDIPFVTYDRTLPLYPADLGYTGSSIEAYETNLLSALSAGNSDRARIRKRVNIWLQASMNLGTIRSGGRVLSKSRQTMPSVFRKALEALERYFYFAYKPVDAFLLLKLRKQVDDKALFEVASGHTNSIIQSRFNIS